MRPLSASAMAIVACALTSVIAVAQTRPATPPRPNRAAQPAPMNRDSQPGVRRAGPVGPRSGPGGTPADRLLRMREQLNLTDDQVTKLEALRTAPRPALNEADMLRARADLMDATRGDVNTEKARAAFDRMARIRTEAQIAQLRSRQDARNVLTPAQRTTVDAWATNLRTRRGNAMRGNAMRGNAMRGNAMRGNAMRGRASQMRAPRNGVPTRGFRGPQGQLGGRRGSQPGPNGMGPNGAGPRGTLTPRGQRGGMPPGPPNRPPSDPVGDANAAPPQGDRSGMSPPRPTPPR